MFHNHLKGSLVSNHKQRVVDSHSNYRTPLLFPSLTPSNDIHAGHGIIPKGCLDTPFGLAMDSSSFHVQIHAGFGGDKFLHRFYSLTTKPRLHIELGGSLNISND